jgi:hypothetical protein
VRVTCPCSSQVIGQAKMPMYSSQVIRQAKLTKYDGHSLHPQEQCNTFDSRPPLKISQSNQPQISPIMAGQIRAAPLVWINAFPGTGKYTIASILANKLMKAQCALIHNHDLVDTVILPRDHPMYRTLRKEERFKAFARHVLAPETRDKCVIFTGMGATHQ